MKIDISIAMEGVLAENISLIRIALAPDAKDAETYAVNALKRVLK